LKPLHAALLATVFGAAVPLMAADAQVDAAAAAGRSNCPPAEPAVLLVLVNAARAAGGDCGRRGPRPALAALAWSDTLTAVAERQARWLARHGELVHVGEGGKRLGDRAHEEGYRWQRINENLALGQAAAAEAVADWLRSDEHCANLLDPGVAEFALACAGTSQGERVWVWVAGRR
jgi:uncharacterized protein YkwD